MNFTLNDEKPAEVAQAANYSPYSEVRQRAIAVRLLHLGFKPEQVAEMVMIRANTIWTWHRHYRQSGIVGLQDQPKSARPRKATAEYCRLLDEALSSDPANYDYAFTIWTTDRLRQHLEQRTGIRLSRARFAELLQRERYVFRRPKKTCNRNRTRQRNNRLPSYSTSEKGTERGDFELQFS